MCHHRPPQQRERHEQESRRQTHTNGGRSQGDWNLDLYSPMGGKSLTPTTSLLRLLYNLRPTLYSFVREPEHLTAPELLLSAELDSAVRLDVSAADG